MKKMNSRVPKMIFTYLINFYLTYFTYRSQQLLFRPCKVHSFSKFFMYQNGLCSHNKAQAQSGRRKSKGGLFMDVYCPLSTWMALLSGSVFFTKAQSQFSLVTALGKKQRGSQLGKSMPPVNRQGNSVHKLHRKR